MRASILLLLALTIAGCGSSSGRTTTVTRTVTNTVTVTGDAESGDDASATDSGDASASADDSEPCTVVRSGSDVQVTFHASDAQKACRTWIQTHGQAGEFWRLVGPDGQASYYETCDLIRDNGAEVIVHDSGGQYNGEQICAYFTGKGFSDAGDSSSGGD